jgi:CubicO group peptidase (beta-lactamase class C family)
MRGPRHQPDSSTRRQKLPDRQPDHLLTTDRRTRPDQLAPADIDALATIAESYQVRGGQPGMAYGIVIGGSLVHARGLGERWLGGPAPDAGTVFRIASMTKSFTAAAVLALRDDGVLALDDPAADYVPELRGLPPATADSPPVSIRHLLTMTAGFPTDDPWGDREQGTPLGEFDAFLADGPRFAWAPCTRFEYANLGYAILGRVITAASGAGYTDFVRDRLLRPLGMTSTGFEAAEFTEAQLARGYRRGAAGWQELSPDPAGAFAPMGGIFSTVSDLCRWVTGFASAFPPGDADAGGPHPLRRASRRDMQLPQVALPPQAPAFPAGSGTGSYGFGLFIEDDAEHGRVVQHSGGYPGFGSHMRWHLATGIGVIALANGTYAPAQPLAARMLDSLLASRPASAGRPVAADQAPSQPGSAPAPGQRAVGGPVPAPGGPWPETLSGQQAVMGLLLAWDDAVATGLFAPNVAQDVPFAERRQKADLVRQRIGEFSEDLTRPAEYDSPAHCRWWLRGDRGVTQAEVLLTPHRESLVQSVTLAVPPAPDSALGQALDHVIALLNDGAAGWPPSLAASPALDTGLLLRKLRTAGAWAGPCTTGTFCQGNGETSVAVELDGATARLILAISVDPVGHQLQQADIKVRN